MSQENEEFEEIEIKKNKTKTKKIEDKVVNSALRNAIWSQMKVFMLAMVSFLLPLFFWIAIIFLFWFILIYMFYLTSIQSNIQNNDFTSKNTNNSVTRLYSALNTSNIDFTNVDAKSFIINSTIPHGFPMTWVVSQLHCSNFYNRSLGWIVYKWHRWFLYSEEYCRKQMKIDSKFSDFAQKYASWNWKLVWNHWWLDIAWPVWTKVFSTTHWKVVRIKRIWGWGKSIDIMSTNWEIMYTLRYAHLSQILVKNWQEVFAWTEIWLSWNTWNSSWPHLHYWICEWANNFQSCYTPRKDRNYKSKLLDPFPFVYNMIINWENPKNLENNSDVLKLEYRYLRTKVKSGVWKPWLTITAQNITWTLKDIAFDAWEKMTKEMIDYVYIKVWLSNDVAPIILKTFHFRERWNWLTNPQPVNKPGWSWKNEWVYWFYSDFSSLWPVCQRTVSNFWPFWAVVTYKQFENQTTCAALALKSKAKWVKGWLDFIKQENFSIEKGYWSKVCEVMSRWNAWEFYCYNKLYPTYSDNTRYQNMPVYTWGKFLNYNKQDGFLKYALDNYNAFKIILQKYTKEN